MRSRMKLSISPAAIGYIREKGGSCHVIAGSQVSACCGRMQLAPTVEVGEPRKADLFSLQIVEGVKLYVPKDFVSPYPLTIDVNCFLGFRRLVIYGWKII